MKNPKKKKKKSMKKKESSHYVYMMCVIMGYDDDDEDEFLEFFSHKIYPLLSLYKYFLQTKQKKTQTG